MLRGWTRPAVQVRESSLTGPAGGFVKLDRKQQQASPGTRGLGYLGGQVRALKKVSFSGSELRVDRLRFLNTCHFRADVFVVVEKHFLVSQSNS